MASQMLNNNPSKAARAFTLMIEEADAKDYSSKFKNSIAEEEAHSIIINEEAEACRNKAEEFIIQKKFDSALYALKRARSKNPNLPGIDKYYAAYAVHKLAAEKKSWYSVLGIQDNGAGFDKIKKHYELAKVLIHDHQQDQLASSSVVIDGAKKLINGAWDVLSDPIRREAYDILMGYRLL